MNVSVELRAESLRRQLSIFDVMEKLSIEFLHRGTHQVPCPFHGEDRKPSARIYADTNKIYCFTCARGWDVLGTVQAKRECSFSDAVSWLEVEFKIEYAGDGLASLVQSKLDHVPRPQLEQFYLMVEDRLIAARDILDLDKYCKYLTALDLVSYRLTQNTLSYEDAVQHLKKLLALTPKA